MSPRVRWPLIALLAVAPALWAHEGHDHDAGVKTPTPAGERAQRLGDGSVFLPKPAQRQLGIRTQRAVRGEHAGALTLEGQVIVDPAAGGVVQAPFAGQISPPAGGFARPGTAVRQGTVLAWIEPGADGLELAAGRAQLAELDTQIGLAQARHARLAQLEGSVPQKDIDSAQRELAGLQARRAALAQGVSGRTALRAPVAGRLLAVRAVAGQRVEARDTLFELAAPGRWLIEARAFDPAQVARLGDAEASVGGQRIPLTWVGSFGRVQEGALPVWFRVHDSAGGLAAGQPARVFARSGQPRPGFALPAEAVTGGGTAAQVWLHTAAERFVARPVTALPLDAGRVLVTAGLQGGERVVVRGAALVGQVK